MNYPSTKSHDEILIIYQDLQTTECKKTKFWEKPDYRFVTGEKLLLGFGLCCIFEHFEQNSFSHFLGLTNSLNYSYQQTKYFLFWISIKY